MKTKNTEQGKVIAELRSLADAIEREAISVFDWEIKYSRPKTRVIAEVWIEYHARKTK
jgi:hypothetical protein